MARRWQRNPAGVLQYDVELEVPVEFPWISAAPVLSRLDRCRWSRQLLRVWATQPNNREFPACGAPSRDPEIRRAYGSPTDRDRLGRCTGRCGLARHR